METTGESGTALDGPSSGRRILIVIGLGFAMFSVAGWVCFGISATLASSACARGNFSGLAWNCFETRVARSLEAQGIGE